MLKTRICLITAALLAGSALVEESAVAINIQINYSYDTAAFFGSGNPQGASGGAQAKAALEAAANFYSTILTDSFSAIQTPAPFHSSTFDGQVVWQWTENFSNPTTNGATTVTNASIAADQYVIYAGSGSLSGSTAGTGGPGGFSWSSNPSGGFTQSEINQINAITQNFRNQVEQRGQATGFARWGGTVSFDRDGSTVWSFNHLLTPAAGTTDFYSVALAELAHALGFGASTEWQSLVSATTFIGVNSKSLNGGNPVPLSTDLAHWGNGLSSVVYGTSTVQQVAMDGNLPNGTRKLVTELDAAGLKDIGWSLGAVPEPSSWILVVMAAWLAPFARSRRCFLM